MGENYELHSRHLNPTLVQVQRTIGFDRVYTRAKGAYLYDAEGQAYLDFLSGYSVFNIGRNHPVVAQAIRDVLDLDLPNMVQMDCSLMSGLLGEALLKKTPPHLDAVFFCNSGTEAVEGAMKFARAATGRPRIVSLQRQLPRTELRRAFHHRHRERSRRVSARCWRTPRRVALGDLDALDPHTRHARRGGVHRRTRAGQGRQVPQGRLLTSARRRSAASTARFSSATRCRRASGGRANGLPSSIGTWSRTSSRWPRALSGGYVPCGAVVARRWIYQKRVQPAGPLRGAFQHVWTQQPGDGLRLGEPAGAGG